MAVGAALAGVINFGVHIVDWLAKAATDALLLVPQNKHTVTVRVYGDPGSKRDDLTFVAQSLATFRLQNFVSTIPLGGWFYNTRAFRLTHDVMNKFVEVSVTISTGPLATLFGAGAAPLGNPLANMEFAPNITGPTTSVNPYPRSYAPGFSGNIPNPFGPPPTQQQAARGAYLASMVAASLAPNYAASVSEGVNTFLPFFNDPSIIAPLPQVVQDAAENE